MSLHSWLRNLRSALAPRWGQHRDRRQGLPEPARYRPRFEVLEDRLTPSFIHNWTFSQQQPIAELTDFTESPTRLVADFSGDGPLDEAWVNWYYEDQQVLVNVYLGQQIGGLIYPSYWETVIVPGLTPYSVGIGDANADGRLDVVIGGYVDWAENYGYVTLFNDGNWGASEPPPPATPSLRVDDVTVTEGSTGTVSATFTVRLSVASADPVTVNYATADGTATGSDYQSASGTLTFAPGETSKTITVLINGDRLGEPNETFVVNLSGATNATISDGQGVGTITDDEPRISISDVTKSEGRRNKTTLFTFTLTLSAAYDQPVTLSYSTANGTATTGDNDYAARTGTLTFAPGETSKTITIVVNGDSKRENNELFYLDLSENSSNSLFTKNRGIGTILNDD